MLDPEIYMKGHEIARRDAMEMMSTYMELIQWRGTADETVLDVGCGSSDVTWEILKPRLPSTARVFGADLAPDMVTYATETYPDVDFFVLDIGTKNLLNCRTNAFDHIFSFHCLHWVRDQRQAMQNIYNMLKPKGDLFAYYITNNPIFDVIFNVPQLTKWKQYIPEEDVHKYTNINQHENSVDVEHQLNEILIEAGFKVSICKIINRQYTFYKLEDLRDYVRAVHPHYTKIPNNLSEEFIDDSTQELIKLISSQEKKIDGNFDEIVLCYSVVVIVATKYNIN